MKTFLRCVVTVIILLGMHHLSFGQTPNLGRAGTFVLFSANGPVSHTGISQISGKVGTNIGSSTGFGNVNGGMHDQDTTSANAATDLLVAYGQIDTVTPNFFIASPFGNGDTLTTGTYELGAASQLSGNLYLDAEGDSSAYFIIKIQGELTSAAGAKVHLVNGAQACNVYWLVKGAMTLATENFVRGTFIVNNGAIILNTLDSLEGRLLTTVGAITVSGISANIPKGCGLAALTGPAEFDMGELACFALFSKSGAVTNTGVSLVTGDVGTNVALTTGFDSLLVEGTIHPTPDTATAVAADSLTAMYTFLNTLPVDIELMEPAQFGNNLILTPHVYLLDAATQFDNTLVLDAEGDSTAVFVIKVNGAFTTGTGSNVTLVNGAKANKVYWKIDGALSIASNSFFKGTAVVNNGAINVASGVRVDGRLMTTTGLLNTVEDTIRSFQNCKLAANPEITTEPVSQTVCLNQVAEFSVQATGDNLTYQWRRGNVVLVDGGNISGATSDTLNINPVTLADADSTYNVIVFGNALPNDTSINVGLTVNPLTAITVEPTDQVSCAGDTVRFTVTASGTNLNYEWYKGAVALVNTPNMTGTDSNTLVIFNPTLADTSSQYYVRVSGLCAPNDTSVMVALTPGQDSLLTQPADTYVCEGETARLSVTTLGAISYQWRRGSVVLVNGPNMSGVNTDSLTIFATTAVDTASNYNVIVTGSCGADTSDFAVIGFGGAPVITSEPANKIVCTGDSAVFNVTATGDSLTYQWMRGNVILINALNYSGVTSPNLVINPVGATDTAANYYVVVSSSCGNTDTSAMVSLSFGTSSLIVSEPANAAGCAGDDVFFTVSASGTGQTYQWRKGNVILFNFGNISGTTTDTLFIDNISALDTSSLYNVIVMGVCGTPDTSVFASLTIDTSLIITGQPSSQLACIGNSANFSVGATGSNLSYQWRRGNVNVLNSGNISGANTATLAFNAVTFADSAFNYNVIISSPCGFADTSNLAALIIGVPPVITVEPSNQTACNGGSTSFTVTASGTGLNYQWRRGNINLVNLGAYSGVNSPTLMINPVAYTDSALNYNVIVSGDCAPNDTSVNVSLTVGDSASITVEPLPQTVCAGSPTSFSVGVVGLGATYQWRRGSVNLVNGGNISGAQSATLILDPTMFSDAGTNYNVIVTGTCGGSDTSNFVTLTVNQAPAIISEPVSQTSCVGDSVTFSVVALGSNLTYQWRRGTVLLTNAANISGATSPNLVINPVSALDVASDYNVIVSGTCLPNDTSVNAALVVNSTALIVVEPISQTVCSGTNVSFTVAATGAGLTYQWRRGNVSVLNGGNISGAQSATLSFTPALGANQAADYNVIVSGSCGAPDTSNFAALVVNQAPVITTEPVTQTVCEGDSMSMTVIASGTGLNYQWRRGNVLLTNTGTVSGANSPTLTIDPVTLADAGNDYNVIVTGNCLPADTSVMVGVSINALPVINGQPQPQTVCEGASASFTVNASGAGLTYQWRRGAVNMVNGGTISGATSPTLTFSATTLTDADNNYNVVVTGSCAPPATSNAVALVVNSAAVLVTGPTSQTVCEGDSVNFTVNATGTGNFYQWRRGIVNLTNTGNISGANSPTLTLDPVATSDAATDYNVVITNSCSPTITSNDAALNVNTLTVITTQPVSQTVCEGTSVTFTATAVGSGNTYQWFKGVTALSDGGNLSGTGTNSLTINPATFADEATDYHLVVNGLCAPAAQSVDVSLVVDNIARIISQPEDTITFIGNSVSFTALVTGDGLTYQWRRGSANLVDGAHISGTNTNTLVLNPTSLADNDFNYNVVITANCGPTIRSDNASLLVCVPLSLEEIGNDEASKVAVLYPNPFSGSISAVIKSSMLIENAELVIYNTMGVKVIESDITKEALTFETYTLQAGVYYYRVISNGKIIQTGKLISHK